MTERPLRIMHLTLAGHEAGSCRLWQSLAENIFKPMTWGIAIGEDEAFGACANYDFVIADERFGLDRAAKVLLDIADFLAPDAETARFLSQNGLLRNHEARVVILADHPQIQSWRGIPCLAEEELAERLRKIPGRKR